MPFLFRGLKTGDAYYPHWVEMRRWKRSVWLIIVLAIALWLPSTVVVWAVLKAVFGSGVPFWWVGLAGFILYLWKCYQIGSWPCPRCGKAFHRTWWMSNFFAESCVHCGLPEYAPHGDF